MTNKFKVGDKVKVVKTNPKWEQYVPELEQLKGFTFDIDFVMPEWYCLNTSKDFGYDWSLQEDCLELIQDEPQKQMVALEDVLEFMITNNMSYWSDRLDEYFRAAPEIQNAIKLLQENNYEVTKKSS